MNPTNEHREQAREPVPVTEGISLDNWPLPDVLNHLANATEHLQHDHNCDVDGWETWKYAAEAARKHISLCVVGWQYVHERDAALIRADGMMCEAHPGLDFGHDPNCAGPGVAWIVEGQAAIEALLSSRDAEVREVLEEFKVADCWCDYGAIFNLHSKRCLKTQALYSKLQAPELQEGLGQSKENSNVDQ